MVISVIPCTLFIAQEIWHGNPIQKFLVEMFELERYELSWRSIVTSFISMTITLPYLLKLSLDIMDIA